MFHLFNIPHVSYSYYRPRIYRQRYNPIDVSLVNAIKRAQEYEQLKRLFYKTIIEEHKSKEQEQHQGNKAQEELINSESAQNEEDVKAKEDNVKLEKASQIPFYYFESHSRFDRKKIVSEEKTHQIDFEGKIHEKLKRRLGEQWYETEEIKNQDGTSFNKEIWHNVSENDYEAFKNEWYEKVGVQRKLVQKEEADENQEQQIEQSLEQKEENNKENELKESMAKETDEMKSTIENEELTISTETENQVE